MLICSENGKASNWSAERVLQEQDEFRSKFNPMNENQILFTGEMIFPFFFEDYFYLRPLKEASEILSKKSDWDPLYDINSLFSNDFNKIFSLYIMYYFLVSFIVIMNS